MTLVSTVSGDSTLDLLVRGLQGVLVGLIGYGVVVGNGSLVVNGLLALVLTFVPTVLEWRYDHEVDPRLDVWIAVAAVIHAAGFLGLYDVQSGLLSWYDQVAHAISASFVAGVGYALIVALDRSSAKIRFPDEFRFVFTLFFILAFGVAWEIFEFAVGGLTSALGDTSILIQYGKEDIVFDLVFNAIAGALVALWGTGYFEDFTAIFSHRLLGRGKS